MFTADTERTVLLPSRGFIGGTNCARDTEVFISKDFCPSSSTLKIRFTSSVSDHRSMMMRTFSMLVALLGVTVRVRCWILLLVVAVSFCCASWRNGGKSANVDEDMCPRALKSRRALMLMYCITPEVKRTFLTTTFNFSRRRKAFCESTVVDWLCVLKERKMIKADVYATTVWSKNTFGKRKFRMCS